MVFKLKKNEEVQEEDTALVGNVDSNENDFYAAMGEYSSNTVFSLISIH